MNASAGVGYLQRRIFSGPWSCFVLPAIEPLCDERTGLIYVPFKNIMTSGLMTKSLVCQ
jgi:hypothetical protein